MYHQALYFDWLAKGRMCPQADLAKFLKTYRPDIPSTTTFSLTSVDGGKNTQTASQAGIEANLDIQYTVGIATGVPVTFVSVGDSTQDGADEGFLDIINALLAEATPPQVLTTSYGFNTETDLSKTLTVALCNSYMQLTSKGVSVSVLNVHGVDACCSISSPVQLNFKSQH